MTNMHTALAARFTDADEIKDVANYGCAGGVSGFIYRQELYDFFQQHEDEIEDVLDCYCITYRDLCPDDAIDFQTIRERAVWFVVESYCQRQVDDDYIAA